MAKYRKKPMEVDAVQWRKPGDHPAVRMSHPWGDPTRPVEPVLDTHNGLVVISEGDWILTRPDGRVWFLDHDQFAAEYEQAD